MKEIIVAVNDINYNVKYTIESGANMSTFKVTTDDKDNFEFLAIGDHLKTSMIQGNIWTEPNKTIADKIWEIETT